MKLKTYPEWCCDRCAGETGNRMPEEHLATYHIGECDICGIMKEVTEPRDYRFPKFETVIFLGVLKHKNRVDGHGWKVTLSGERKIIYDRRFIFNGLSVKACLNAVNLSELESFEIRTTKFILRSKYIKL